MTDQTTTAHPTTRTHCPLNRATAKVVPIIGATMIGINYPQRVTLGYCERAHFLKGAALVAVYESGFHSVLPVDDEKEARFYATDPRTPTHPYLRGFSIDPAA